jgi:hypothetical protein
VCEQCVTKYLNAEFKQERYFVNKVETQLREKPLGGSQTQEFHYSEDKASTTHIPWCSNHTLHSEVYLYTNASQPGLLLEGVFNGFF